MKRPMTVPKRPMTVTSRSVTLRDFAIFQLKLALDGFKDMIVFTLSIVAIVLDFIAGRGERPRLFYSVMRTSERFDAWLNLHGTIQKLDESGGEDGLFGASDAGSDSLIGQIEQLVRGGDEPRGRKGSAHSSPDEPRTGSNAPRTESNEPRTESNEPHTESNEPPAYARQPSGASAAASERPRP